MNKITQTSRSTSNTSNSKFNADITQWIEEGINEEKEIGILKCRRESNFENTDEEVKETISEENRLKYLSVAEKVTLKL